MSRRKVRIKRVTHKERPHGHMAAQYRHIENPELDEHRRTRKEVEDNEMKRLIDNGIVDATQRYDAKYVSQISRVLGWNQTRFDESLRRVATMRG